MSSHDEARLQFERQHWWLSGRRDIVQRLAKRFLKPSLSARLRICEIDCGLGVNLEPWQAYHDVLGVESNADLIPLAERVLQGHVVKGMLPNALPLDRQAWDLVLMLDTLASIPNGHRAAEVALQLLRPGGIMIATVPSRLGFRRTPDSEALRGSRAVDSNLSPSTRRRFSRVELRRCFDNEEYRVELLSFFNCIPSRLRGGSFDPHQDREAAPGNPLGIPRALNRCLHKVLEAEGWLLPYAPLPFGYSLVVVVRRLTEAEFVSDRKYPLIAFETPYGVKQVA